MKRVEQKEHRAEVTVSPSVLSVVPSVFYLPLLLLTAIIKLH